MFGQTQGVAEIGTVKLCCVPADFGRGANDGAYYPVGLLTIAGHLRRASPDIRVSVADMHHAPDLNPVADLVGIAASSTLNYRNVLALASRAKAKGAIVVLGGPHVTQLADQVLANRPGLVDFVLRGNAERAFAKLIAVLRRGGDLNSVPGLSWRLSSGERVHNPGDVTNWQYDDYVPLDLQLLECGIEPYWRAFRRRVTADVDAAFVVFTHFGCGYRELMQRRSANTNRLANWCSYCSLGDAVAGRKGHAIVREVLELLSATRVRAGSNVLLKCYGDNVGTQRAVLEDLAESIDQSEEWRTYRIGWTFYVQSSRLTTEVAALLARVGTRSVYIGFDSADDEVQRQNGLGTSLTSHRRAVRICKEHGLQIQAGFVLGCAGETRASVDNTLRFAEEIAEQGVLERVNAAVLFVIPGSPAYARLCASEPWIAKLDELPTVELQSCWLKHYCPHLGADTAERLQILRDAANRLDELSPGPHASMGFVSKRLEQERVLAEDGGT